MLRAFQPESKFNDLDDWHFADDRGRRWAATACACARGASCSAGARRARVATRGRFQLIEAMIPRGVLSSTLARFVAGVKRISGGKS